MVCCCCGEGGGARKREREREGKHACARERESMRARERRRRHRWPCSPSCLRKSVRYVVVRGGRARARERECACARARGRGTGPYLISLLATLLEEVRMVRCHGWGGQARQRENKIESACARKTEKERERCSPCRLSPSCLRMSILNVVCVGGEEREQGNERASVRVTCCRGWGDRTRERQRRNESESKRERDRKAQPISLTDKLLEYACTVCRRVLVHAHHACMHIHTLTQIRFIVSFCKFSSAPFPHYLRFLF